MATFIKAKKRRLTQMERRELDAFKKALYYLTKDHGKQVCDDFVPDCAACQYYMLTSLIKWHIQNIEWLLTTYEDEYGRKVHKS